MTADHEYIGPTRMAALAALGVAAFALTAGAIRAALPAPDLFEGAQKLEYLRAHPDDVTALIVGTSSLFQGLDPNVLDPIVQETVPDFRSFNLGARSMKAFESDKLLREALDALDGRVKWVVLEAQHLSPVVESQYRGTLRNGDWHDLRQTWAVLRIAIEGTRAGRHWSWWIPMHVETMVSRYGNVGESERLLAALTGREPLREMTTEEIERGRGYISIEDDMGEAWRARRERFLDEKLPVYQERVERLREGHTVVFLDSQLDVYREQRAFLASRGVTVLYVMPPYDMTDRFAKQLAERGEMPNLLDYADPDLYPELYAVEARLDQGHLTREAAVRWSERVGRDLAELLREE
ncbi:MAG: hypothetical protein R3F34_06260 [Planctomycetota bacterium]